MRKKKKITEKEKKKTEKTAELKRETERKREKIYKASQRTAISRGGNVRPRVLTRGSG